MNKKIKKIIHSKVFVIVLTIILILSIGIVGTYAWLTWSSPENTTLTMTIGDLADVIFTNGNDINTSLTPVYNYTDGEKTTFTINHRGMSSNIVAHTVTLNITSIPEVLRNESLKYKLVGSNNYITEGDFSDATDNSSITLVDNLELGSDDTEYTFYLYIDSNMENNSNMMNQNFVGNITFTANELESTPLSDFEYVLGSDSTTIDTINYYHKSIDTVYYDVSIKPITIEENEVILLRYIGSNPEVKVPNTYTVNGVTYNTVILSSSILIETANVAISDRNGGGVFSYNDLITDVSFDNKIKFISKNVSNYKTTGMNYIFYGCTSLIDAPVIPNSVTSMSFAFHGCTSLVNVPNIPDSVTDIGNTFANCTSLVNVPEIPDSVTVLSGTFEGCTSLVNAPEIPDSVMSLSNTFSNCRSLVNAPEIPDSVTNMSNTFSNCRSLVNAPEIPDSVMSLSGTFSYCTSLVNAPEIPDSVTNMQSTFYNCTSLVNAPEIPDSVTNMAQTFQGCTSLVNAPVIPDSVTNMQGTFSGCTSLVNAPVIPDSVTNMTATFSRCTNLTGTVKINSSNVTSITSAAAHPFHNTGKEITVEVPTGSTTYNSLNTYKPSNITITTY